MAHKITTFAEKPTIGIALGGGVARGWAHIGVMRTLKRIGLEPDFIAGTSIGALVGGAYLGDKMDVLEEWALDMTKLKLIRYMDFKIRSGGLIGGQRLVAEMQKHVGKVKIEELSKPFVAIACDLMTGHEVWIREGVLVKGLRASISLPGIFPPIPVDNRWLVDGALVNPVPVSTCHAMGAQMVIAVNLSADPLGKNRQPGSSITTAAGFDLMNFVEAEQAGKPGMLDKMVGKVLRREKNSPSMFGVMVSALGITLDRITRMRMAGDPPDVHITPHVGHVGLLEFDRADELIKAGEKAALAAIPDIKDALKLYGINPDDIIKSDV